MQMIPSNNKLKTNTFQILAIATFKVISLRDKHEQI